VARGVWVAVAILIGLAVWAAASLRHAAVPAAALLQPPPRHDGPGCLRSTP
jgi:hypothetical protein